MAKDKKKKKKRHNQVTFKHYDQNQAWLLPPSLGELIPSGHLVRLVNSAIDGMDLEPILNTYEGGGSSTYHPRMMLKALVYAYIEKIYSSRKIEKALKENICFMWLCGMQQPDHNTINRFRNDQLKQTVKDVFGQVLYMLVEQGYVQLNDYYVDGTIMEAVSNRYTYVWAKNVDRYKKALLNKIAAIIEHIEAVNEQEESQAKQEQQDTPFIEDSAALAQTIERVNEQIHEQLPSKKKLSKDLKKLKKEHLPKLQAYEQQEELLNGRSSYSKTDVDATFMRTKDDHLSNGQLKPCYNIQIGTEQQFIINYTLHQTSSDMRVFTSHMDNTLDFLNTINVPTPKRVGADAGYGSEENYEYLESQGIEAFVKYPGYYKEQKGNYRKTPFHINTLHYNKEGDYFICPMGQKMMPCGKHTKTTRTGYKQSIHLYKAQRCQGCPLRGQCHKKADNRVLQINHNAANYRQQAKHRLDSLRGIRMRQQRNVDVEPVFGHIKQNRNFRRFMLTGLEGVSTETGLLAIAHNIKKWWVKMHGRSLSLPPNKPANSAQLAINSVETAHFIEKVRA